AATLGDQRRLARILSSLGSSLRYNGEIDAAIEVGERALAIARGLGEISLEVEAGAYLGGTYSVAGDYARAVQLLRRNLDDRRDPSMFFDHVSAVYLTVALSQLGRFAEGTVLGEEVVRLATANNRPVELLRAYTSLGLLYARKGDLDHAISLLEGGLEVSRIWSLMDWSASAMAVLGHAYQLAGRLDKALPLLEQALESEDGPTYPQYLAWLSEGYLRAGRLAEACERGQQAVELSRKLKTRGHEAYAGHALAASKSQLDPPDVQTAEGHYRQAMALATELGMLPLVAHCHLGLGN